MNAVDSIINFAASAGPLPANVRLDTIRHLRDTIAVGIAGSTAPHAEDVRRTAQSFGAGTDSRILGTQLRLPAASAAFVNAFQIHCLEWDAVHEPAVVHALSVPVATLLAGSDRQADIDPEQYLISLAISVDIAARIGLAATEAMRFFRPATAGVLGAALGLARLYGMNTNQMHDVLGLAYSQASGTMQAHSEGSIALPLQIGFAARSAVTAVELVRNGLSGPHDVLDGPYGFFKLFEANGNIASQLGDLGSRWCISEVSTKPFPTGRAAHGTLSTLRRLQREHRFTAADVEKIEALLPPLPYRLVSRPYRSDMTPAYARLCLQFVAALLLIDGDISPARCVATSFQNGALIDLAARIHPIVDDNKDMNALTPQLLRLWLKDGRKFEADIPHVLGAPKSPMTDEDYDEKLEKCLSLAAAALGADAAALLKSAPHMFATQSDLI